MLYQSKLHFHCQGMLVVCLTEHIITTSAMNYAEVEIVFFLPFPLLPDLVAAKELLSAASPFKEH